jgi:hypothetical protein
MSGRGRGGGRRRALVALLGFVAMATPATAPAAAIPQDRAALWGAVLGPDGSRLPGAVVSLARAEGGEARVAAGALGLYRAAGLVPGTWTLTAGALTCRELLGIDVFTADGLSAGRQRGLFRERCPRYVRDAITILESVSADPGAKASSGNRP